MGTGRYIPTAARRRTIRILRGTAIQSAAGMAIPLSSRPPLKEGHWLDNSGHPHTEALRITERYRRIEFGRMELVATD